MKKYAFHLIFALGALALVWVATAVASKHLPVLVMTAVIGAVYLLGTLELQRYRATTALLLQALDAVPTDLQRLQDWLAQVPAVLRDAVRQRIEGERSALPGPAFTPYLVGLLVMLGMLGTFMGMVLTLNGAVFALEGSSSVQGMRAAFSEPVKGLGLAFGTSVAGVATSAMLGLMSSLSRRERSQAAGRLDALIGGSLRPFSLAHQRAQTLSTLQQQSLALPQVVAQLQTLMDRMAQHSQQLGDRLLANQDGFHREMQSVYGDLARSVDESLRSSLRESMHLASESIRPVVQATLDDMAQQGLKLHQRMVESTREQLGTLNQQFSSSANDVAQTWRATLSQHEQASASLVTGMDRTLQALGQTFEARSQDLVTAVRSTWTEQQAVQSRADQQRLDRWQASLQAMAADLQTQWDRSGQQTLAQQQQICDTLVQTAQTISSQVHTQAQQTLTAMAQTQAQQSASDAQRLAAWQAALEDQGAALQSHWQAAGAQTLAQLQQVLDALGQTAAQIRSDNEIHSTRTVAEITRLLASSEELVRARIAAEADAAAVHTRRAEELASLLRTELAALREQEAQRGDAAVARLADLQTAVTEHLRTLGTALEDPITRLIDTASEAPRAAAEVIAQLRQELSAGVARDNALLEERARILGTLSTLLAAIDHASTEQRGAIDALVTSSQASLTQASEQFHAHVAAETGRLGEVAALLTASAVDVASLGETFGFAVRSFNETHEKLITSLQRIEAAIGQSMTRSDEQLAYYVAQARELIDLSISSQKDVLEALQQRQTVGAV